MVEPVTFVKSFRQWRIDDRAALALIVAPRHDRRHDATGGGPFNYGYFSMQTVLPVEL